MADLSSNHDTDEDDDDENEEVMFAISSDNDNENEEISDILSNRPMVEVQSCSSEDNNSRCSPVYFVEADLRMAACVCGDTHGHGIPRRRRRRRRNSSGLAEVVHRRNAAIALKQQQQLQQQQQQLSPLAQMLSPSPEEEEWTLSSSTSPTPTPSTAPLLGVTGSGFASGNARRRVRKVPIPLLSLRAAAMVSKHIVSIYCILTRTCQVCLLSYLKQR